MNYEPSHSDLDSLKILYDEQVALLRKKLLEGAIWESMEDQRAKLQELSIAMYQKVQSDLQTTKAVSKTITDLKLA